MNVTKHAKPVIRHIIMCLDGEKEPPRWLHRSYRLGHLTYLCTAAIGVAAMHEHTVVVLCCLSLVSLVVGSPRRDLEAGE